MQQLSHHPLRGSIFESWMVSEIAKRRRHRGEASGLYHFRDQHGLEVDLVVENPEGLDLFEAKSGRTLAGDMWDELNKVAGLFPDGATRGRHLVYGGDETVVRSAGTAVPWFEVGEPSDR